MTAPSGLPAPGESPRSNWAYLPLIEEAARSSFYDLTVGERIAQVAQRHPDRKAIVWLDSDDSVCGVTWSTLYQRAREVAAALIALRPGRKRIGIVGRDRAQWIQAFYGAACAGYAIVPLPSNDDAGLLANQCRRVGVDLVVACDDYPDVGGLDGQADVRFVRVSRLEKDGALREPVGPVIVSASDPFLFQLTSGTTGTPKVAVLSHRAVLCSAEWYGRSSGAEAGATIFNPLPFEHVGGTVGGLATALSVGGSYIAIGQFDPETVVKVIRLTLPSVIGLVPTMIFDLLSEGGATPKDFASVVSIVGGATNVDPALIDETERDLGIRFLVAYGQSEAPCMTMSGLQDPAMVRTRTIGRPLPGRDYCVITNTNGLAASGQVGELCVRGPLTMSGYLASSGLIVPVDDGDGWMRTGDLCSMTDGVLTFHARLRDVVIRGGENLYPAEIEVVLAANPVLQEVVVFGAPDPRLGERLVAAVRTVPGTIVNQSQLDEFATAHLPRKKRPTQWYVVDDFPRTSTGKVRKVELARTVLGVAE